jgi:hypothetical protein
MINFNEVVDELMLFFSKGEFSKEVTEAKLEFHKIIGMFDGDSNDMEIKINLFIDWFIFKRHLEAFNKSPINYLCEKNEFPVSDHHLGLINNLCSSRLSLFEFIKVRGEDVYVKDLCSDYKLTMKKSPFIVGFRQDEIFSARIIPFEDSFVFSKAFCIHPSEAKKFILKEIKKLKRNIDNSSIEEREDLVFRLLKMRYKIDQYRHINLRDIYTEQPKLRI